MRKLLIVDDEPGVRESIRFTFAGNYEVYTTASVTEAVTVVAFQRFDIIILDLFIDTEKEDGLKVLKVIRHLDPSVPVIILTAYGCLESAQEAVRLGADDYLTKPYDVPSLQQRVAKLVQKGDERRQKDLEPSRSLRDIEFLLSDIRNKPEACKKKSIELSLQMIQANLVSSRQRPGFEPLNLSEMLSDIVYVLTGKEIVVDEVFITGNKLLLMKAFFRLIRKVNDTGSLTVSLKKAEIDAECEIVGTGFILDAQDQSLSLRVFKVHEGAISQIPDGVMIRLPLDFSGSQKK
jgi:DNA-binding response OmpR family regulator